GRGPRTARDRGGGDRRGRPRGPGGVRQRRGVGPALAGVGPVHRHGPAGARGDRLRAARPRLPPPGPGGRRDGAHRRPADPRGDGRGLRRRALAAAIAWAAWTTSPTCPQTSTTPTT